MTGVTVYGISEIVLAITACAASVAMFLYPLPSLIRLHMGWESSKRGVQLYHVTSSCTVLSCIMWVSFIWKLSGNSFQSLCVLGLSEFGALLQMCYMCMLEPHIPDRQSSLTLAAMMVEVLVMMFFGGMCMDDDFISVAEKDMVIGLACAVFGIVMYASTIPSIVNAYKTQSTKYLPLGLCAMHFLNAIAWFAYAFYTPTYDVYLVIAHGAGIILGIVQLLICRILVVKFGKLGAMVNPDIDPTKTPLLDSIV